MGEQTVQSRRSRQTSRPWFSTIHKTRH